MNEMFFQSKKDVIVQLLSIIAAIITIIGALISLVKGFGYLQTDNFLNSKIFIITLSVFALSLAFLVIYLIIRIRRQKTYFVPKKLSERGNKDRTDQLLSSADEFIHLMHSKGSEPPTDDYLKAIRDAHERRVDILRLVMCPESSIDNDKSTSWIRGQIQKNIGNHEFFPIELEHFPFEFYIIDRKIAVIAMPTLDYQSTTLPWILISRNPAFIQSLDNAFNRLLKISRSIKTP